jgi:tetratricopeptide (TPR) repeat protein
MKWKLIAAALIVSATALAGAQSFSADYVQGQVDLQQTGGWYGIAIGDSIPADATIRLGSNSYAELSDGLVTLKLAQPGVYRIPALVKGSADNNSAGLGSILTQRVAALAGSSNSRDGAVAGGVRARQAPTGPPTIWAGGENPDDLISQGLTLMQQGNFDEAYYRFKDAYDSADSTLAPEAGFYVGYAASLRNDTRNAIKYLSEFKPSPTTSYYSDQVLTLAQLYVQTFAYRSSLDLLSPYIAGGNEGDQSLETAYLLEGIAYRGLGDTARSKSALIRARDLIPGSKIAAAAAKLLAGM